MCFGLFDAPKTPELPAPPPLPAADPKAYDTKQARGDFQLAALRRRAATAGRANTIKTSPLGITASNGAQGKKLLGA